jgi:DNA repair protein RAD5
LDPDSKAISIEDDDEAKDGQGGHLFYFNPYSGELTLEFPTQKLVARGGILADSMGMGKTLVSPDFCPCSSPPP